MVKFRKFRLLKINQSPVANYDLWFVHNEGGRIP